MSEGKKVYGGIADIQNATDSKTVELQIPEWGNKWFKLRSLTAGERNHLENSMFRNELIPTKDDKGNETFAERRIATGVNFRTLLVGMCLVNGDGVRIFDDQEIGMLEVRDAQVVDRLFKQAQDLNALQAGAVETAKKD